MAETISYCKKCKQVYGDGRKVCNYCKSFLDETDILVSDWNKMSTDEILQTKEKLGLQKSASSSYASSNTQGQNAIAVMLKVFSVILFIADGVGCFILYNDYGIEMAMALMYFAICAFFCLLTYGFGEVISILSSINRKMK